MTNPLIPAIAFILLLGGTLMFVAEPTMSESDIQDLKDDSWASPFVSIVEWTFKPFEFVVGAIKGTFFIFGGGDPEETAGMSYLTLNGTDNDFFDSDNYGQRYYEEGDEYIEWGKGTGNNPVIRKEVNTSYFEVYVRNWLFFEDVVYNGTYNSGNEKVDLSITSTGENDYNLSSSAEIIGFADFLEGKQEEFDNFMGELSSYVSEKVALMGLIPSALGIPLMLLIIISMIVGIIKLFPTT